MPAIPWSPILLSLQLAAVTTALLLLLATPLAWWLAFGRSRLRPLVAAVTGLPLVLPPTVLGFYLLLLLGPHGPIGAVTSALGLPGLLFSFEGLVVGSLVFSLPFVVLPLRAAFGALGRRPLEVAATLRAGPLDRFVTVVVPRCAPAFATAASLGFAHTVGEFGVVLMIGGNVPGQTRVASVAVFEAVERIDYAQAHTLSAVLVLLSLAVLLLVQATARGTDAVPS